VCDLVYVIRVEQLERRVLADRQALLSRGVVEGLPEFDSEQEAFDAWLVSEPADRTEMSPADLARFEELAALGVASMATCGSGSGARDFLAVSKALKAAGETELRKELNKTVRDAAKPLAPKVRESARNSAPKHGGLNERLAKKPYRVQTRTGAKTAGVRIVGTKVDSRINDLGRIQHPVFGGKKKVVQYDQNVKGYFDKPLEESGPAISREVVSAMDSFVRKLVRGI
jgi:hypothetical protein